MLITFAEPEKTMSRIRKAVEMTSFRKDDHDDLVQEVAMKLLRCSRADVPDRYILRTAKNAVIDKWRTNVRQVEVQDTQYSRISPEFKDIPIDDMEDVEYEDFTETRIMARQVLNRISSMLPEGHRVCLMLYGVGYKTPEISRRMGIPEATVKTRIHYSRKTIKEKLGPCVNI